MITRLTSTEAVRGFSDLLNRVAYQKEEFLIERGGEPICRVSPLASVRKFTMGDLRALVETLPDIDEGFAEDVQAGIREQPPMEDVKWS